MAVVSGVKRFEIWLVNLDPTKGSEIRKPRPCLVISPDEMNIWLNTVIVAPMTSAVRSYSSRVAVRFDKKNGQIALDQMRSVDKARLLRKMGRTTEKTRRAVCDTLREMFAL